MIRLLLLALSSLLLLQSCLIEGEEEIWINLDASGKAKVHYEIPTMALVQIGDPADYVASLERIDEEEDAITINDLSFENNGTQTTFHLELEFDNALDLLDLVDRQGASFAEETGMDSQDLEQIAGDLNFDIASLSPSLERKVSLDGFLPKALAKYPGVLGPSNFRYIIHLPLPVEESNAHEISNGGKTLSWKFLLRNHAEKPMIMTLKIQPLIPWWVWVIGGLFFFGFVYLVWRLLFRRKKKAA